MWSLCSLIRHLYLAMAGIASYTHMIRECGYEARYEGMAGCKTISIEEGTVALHVHVPVSNSSFVLG